MTKIVYVGSWTAFPFNVIPLLYIEWAGSIPVGHVHLKAAPTEIFVLEISLNFKVSRDDELIGSPNCAAAMTKQLVKAISDMVSANFV
ncbi:hypothetical protein Y032_0594g420 [Ancylostoma ceylanicum]|uniref:Uncharacterized protein n=1 Tax=Ancylostoma ceylanicum TaxID=53326 RepID=A0A016WP65_9BILA|nr:hypothetical protein Y032_0594g420 [Ancylostoma ceylanicum]